MSKLLLTVVYICHYLAFSSLSLNRIEWFGLVVCIPNIGCIKGINMEGYQTETFHAFMGIPYAQPPVGKLRFKNPQRMPKFPDTHTIDATKAKPDCIHKNYLLPNPVIQGKEDCLYLNVYRPVPYSKELLPVMVYIHGGGFNGGSAGPSVSGPEYFMDTQVVILVTVAYRLGPLGFLSTEDDNMPGNYGLKDQNLALKWVQENIIYFGGDKRRVTLFGQSVGAVDAHLHLFSPMSAGFFKSMITMSGTANVPFGLNQKPLQKTRLTAEFCEIPNADTMSTADLTRALRNMTVFKLINAEDYLKFWEGDPKAYYRPVIEPPGKDAFLTADPEELMEKGNYTKLPWLLGTVPEEGAGWVINIMENATVRQNFNGVFHYNLLELTEFPSWFNETQKDEKTRILINDYFNGIHELEEQTLKGFLNLITDRHFKYPLYKVIRNHVRTRFANVPFYMYSFNYKGPVSYASIYAKANVTRNYGVVHGDDLLYLFRSPQYFPDFKKDSTEAKVIKSFVRYFVSFARNGVDNHVPKLIPCSTRVLDSRPEAICDYHEFVNSSPNDFNSDGFSVRVNNKYRTVNVKFWMELLKK